MSKLFRWLFGCAHTRTTYPITPGRSSARKHTYVCCLDCGRELDYDWKQIR